MYFVTMKQPGYALFSTTPSEQAAIGLTEDQRRVHVLARTSDGWRVARDWPIEEHSHTELMVRLGGADEPVSIDELVRLAIGT